MSETESINPPKSAAGSKGTNGSHAKTAPESDAPKRSFVHSPAFRIFVLALIVLGVGGAIYWSYARHFEETDDAYIEGAVIAISPQVSARVAKVYVSDNQLVHAGDLLVELDPTDYQVALDQMKGAEAAAAGMVEQAKAGIVTAQSTIAQAQAELDSAQTNYTNADQDLKRYKQLDERAKSKQAEDKAVAVQKAAAAAVAQAKAKVVSTQSQVVSAQASVAAAQGELEKARANTHGAEVKLCYCKIIAATDGRITNKNVDPGRYVTPAMPMFDIVPPEVWVVANFKETQLAHMVPGQAVTISIDAYPDRDYHGKVQSIQAGTGSRFSVIPAENATGNYVKVVQRLPVKIVFDGDANADANHLLSPGMSVTPKVRISE